MYGTVSGGYGNISGTALLTYGATFVGGGSLNTASSDYSSVVGGFFNTASSSYSAVSGGCSNTASGFASVVSGGQENVASATFASVTNGIRGVANRFSQRSFTSGRFAVTGDSQFTELVLRKVTTNATPTELFLVGTTRINIESGYAMFATLNIAGFKSDGTEAAHYCRKVAIKNLAGTTSLIGAVSTIGTDVETQAGYDVTISADDTNDALAIFVTGGAETIRWTAYVSAVETAVVAA